MPHHHNGNENNDDNDDNDDDDDYDYDDDDDDDNYDDNNYDYEESYRHGDGGLAARENCAKSEGIMSDLEQPGKIRVSKWSKCSIKDFNWYIIKNGGKRFCLYLTQQRSRDACSGIKPNITATTHRPPTAGKYIPIKSKNVFLYSFCYIEMP